MSRRPDRVGPARVGGVAAGGKGRGMFDSSWRARSRDHSASHFSFGSGHAGDTGHLATEAIAAYVDGELRMNAHMRASGHIAGCPSCAAEVEAQRQARTVLQSSAVPSLPEDLLGELRSIPHNILSAADADESAERNHRRRRFF